MRVRNLGIGVLLAVAVVVGSGCNPDKNKLLFKPQAGVKRLVDTEEAMNLYQAMDKMRKRFGDRVVMRATGLQAKSIGRMDNPFDGQAPVLLANRRT